MNDLLLFLGLSNSLVQRKVTTQTPLKSDFLLKLIHRLRLYPWIEAERYEL